MAVGCLSRYSLTIPAVIGAGAAIMPTYCRDLLIALYASSRWSVTGSISGAAGTLATFFRRSRFQRFFSFSSPAQSRPHR